jgi:hypothetical protein
LRIAAWLFVFVGRSITGLDTLHAFFLEVIGIPKFIAKSDPAAQWTGAHKGHAFFAYANEGRDYPRRRAGASTALIRFSSKRSQSLTDKQLAIPFPVLPRKCGLSSGHCRGKYEVPQTAEFQLGKLFPDLTTQALFVILTSFLPASREHPQTVSSASDQQDFAAFDGNELS